MTGQGPDEVRRLILATVHQGQIRTGVVSSIATFGVFVDLGGIDGLITVPNLSWTYFEHPSDVVAAGQEITVEVLSVDIHREHISLSLKAMREDPWRRFTHRLGEVFPGRVTKLAPIGAFVRIEAGVEGLVPFSEPAEHHVGRPEHIVQVGDEIYVKSSPSTSSDAGSASPASRPANDLVRLRVFPGTRPGRRNVDLLHLRVTRRWPEPVTVLSGKLL